MDRPFLLGEKTYLRPIELSDANGPYLQWINTPDARLYLGSVLFPTSKDALERYIRTNSDRDDAAFFGIMVKTNDQFIGTARLTPIDWRNRYTTIGIFIGEPSARRQGYGSEVIKLLLDYGFNHLNLHKVTAGMPESNQASIRMFEKCGLREECRRKRHLFVNGRWEDHVILSMFQEEYQR